MIYGILSVGIVIFWWVVLRPAQQKKALLKKGIPEEWLKWIEENLAFYQLLDEALKVRFQKRVHSFILEKPIFGYQTKIDHEIKLMVASSSVALTLKFEHWNFNYLESVMIVEGPLNDDYKTSGAVLGQVNIQGLKNQMVLSKQSLVHGFQNFKDKKNVGIHEFAHVLDHADGEVDGIPKALMSEEMIESWRVLVPEKIREIELGNSDINPYGATNEAEFFAVVTEYFFERPDLLGKNHPRLFELMREIFQQDHTEGFLGKIKNFKKTVDVGRNSPCPCGSGKKFKKCCLQ